MLMNTEAMDVASALSGSMVLYRTPMARKEMNSSFSIMGIRIQGKLRTYALLAQLAFDVLWGSVLSEPRLPLVTLQRLQNLKLVSRPLITLRTK